LFVLNTCHNHELYLCVSFPEDVNGRPGQVKSLAYLSRCVWKQDNPGVHRQSKSLPSRAAVARTKALHIDAARNHLCSCSVTRSAEHAPEFLGYADERRGAPCRELRSPASGLTLESDATAFGRSTEEVVSPKRDHQRKGLKGCD